MILNLCHQCRTDNGIARYTTTKTNVEIATIVVAKRHNCSNRFFCFADLTSLLKFDLNFLLWAIKPTFLLPISFGELLTRRENERFASGNTYIFVTNRSTLNSWNWKVKMLSIAKTSRFGIKSVVNAHSYHLRRCFGSLKAKEAIDYGKFDYTGPSSIPSIEYQSAMQNTAIWSQFTPDDNDIYVVTPARCGTALVQEIIGQLLYHGDYYNELNISNYHAISPWITNRTAGNQHTLDMLNNQLNNDNNVKRRCIKLHEPIETLKYNEKCKYIFIARDYHDMVWSAYRFYCSWSDKMIQSINS